MSVFGPAHPLDVDLAELADGLLDDARTDQVEAHLAACLVCRARLGRLRDAAPIALHLDRPLPSPAFSGLGTSAAGETAPAPGELWLASDGAGGRLLVLIVRTHGGRLLVAPVTFDVESGDDETLVLDHPGLAVFPRLAMEVPRSVLVERTGTTLDLTAARRGTAVVDATDPRIEIRQFLADRLGSLEDQPADPGTAAEAPPLRPEHVRSALIADLRAMRGRPCVVRPLDGWGEVLLAHQAGWAPMATVDEIGIVLVVLDTPHGLADDADFDVARSVLTRFNATALVVLAGAVSDTAEVFDSSSLNYGIDAPSGNHTPPRPLISGLAPFDAVAKFLDQSSGARAAAPAARGPVTRVDVDDILRESAAAAVAEAVRQGSRFKIAPKRRGYESIADAEEGLAAALAHAFGAEPTIVQDLLAL
ncbi:MAG TPA: zf-HC2 domain-containing protein [Acidimicrobiales bacterium]